MDITQEKVGGVVAAVLKGRVDAGTSKAVEDALLKLIDGGERRLVVDLAAVDYISSVGLRVLIVAARRLKPLQGTVAVCSLQPAIKQIFEIAGFTAIFKIYATRGEAFAALEGHAAV